MLAIKKTLTFLLLMAATLELFAQQKCQEIDDKDAIKNYEKGIDRKKYQKEERVILSQKSNRRCARLCRC